MLDEQILSNFGGYEYNNLQTIIKSYFDQENDISDVNLNRSPYFSHDSFIDILKSYKGKFTVFSLNCQSINAKFSKLLIFIEEMRQIDFEFSVICLQETWLEEGADLSQFIIPNYTCIAQGKHCSQHGGLITYIHNSYEFDKYTLPVQSNLWEALVIRIMNTEKNGKHIHICNIYRPPTDNFTNTVLSQFTDEINNLVSVLYRSKSAIILMGDFNIDLLSIKNKPSFKEYLDNLMSFGLYPAITLPTRLTDNRGTLIDNIFYNFNEDKIYSSGILLSDMSDHLPYFGVFDFENIFFRNTKKKHIYYRKIDDNALHKLYQCLEDVDLMSSFSMDPCDINLNYNLMETILIKMFNQCIPLKKLRFHKHRHKKSGWITTGLIKSIKYRDCLYKRMKQTNPTSDDYNIIKHNLKVYNRILKRSIRNAKALFYQNKFNNCNNDSTKSWNIINEILNRSNLKQLPEYMIINDYKVFDQDQIANQFNKFFGSVGHTMAGIIPSNNTCNYIEYLTENINSTFNFQPVNSCQIKKTVQNLKSSSSAGYDGISNILLKYLEPLLNKPLTLLVNQSLKSGIFPDSLKLAKITPIYKKDDVHLIENYRPISVLPSISKVFEKIVFEQLSLYFITNNYFCPSQYGFRKNHSTEHAILEVVDQISSDLDKGNTPIALFLDLS